MRIRQLALAARELDPVVEDLCNVFDVEVIFRDPGVAEFGLVNALFRVGDCFLEVVAPVRENAPAARFLARRGGDAGYMLLMQTDDLKSDRQRLDALGVRIIWEFAAHDIAAMHLHPRDIGGAIVSLDQPQPPPSWRWGGPGWEDGRVSPLARDLTGITLGSPDPDALSRRWSEVLDQPRSPRDDGYQIPVDGGRLCFEAAGADEREGIVAAEIRTDDVDAVLERARKRGLPIREAAVSVGGTWFELSR